MTDTLWAPWRIGYVTEQKPPGCVFCTKPGQDMDRQNLILFRGTFCFVILNLYPYNNGHLMVVPFEHVGGVEDLSTDAIGEMMALTQQSIGVLRDKLHPTAFNIGINQGVPAGAGVADHVHLHVVPRWVGDTNFMPVLADTRVMPQSLTSSYDLLVGGFVSE
jgi:ATP adenylyltransferase